MQTLEVSILCSPASNDTLRNHNSGAALYLTEMIFQLAKHPGHLHELCGELTNALPSSV